VRHVLRYELYKLYNCSVQPASVEQKQKAAQHDCTAAVMLAGREILPVM
jgi:hypothetical protein